MHCVSDRRLVSVFPGTHHHTWEVMVFFLKHFQMESRNVAQHDSPWVRVSTIKPRLPWISSAVECRKLHSDAFQPRGLAGAYIPYDTLGWVTRSRRRLGSLVDYFCNKDPPSSYNPTLQFFHPLYVQDHDKIQPIKSMSQRQYLSGRACGAADLLLQD